MCGLAGPNWLLSLTMLVLFSAIVVASVVFVVRELNRPRHKCDE